MTATGPSIAGFTTVQYEVGDSREPVTLWQSPGGALYLPLTNIATNQQFCAERGQGQPNTVYNMTTSYRALRLALTPLASGFSVAVKRGDTTFAERCYPSGSAANSGWCNANVCWGSSGACTGGIAMGTVAADLQGTPFTLPSASEFVVAGFDAGGAVTVNATSLQGSADGMCGLIGWLGTGATCATDLPLGGTLYPAGNAPRASFVYPSTDFYVAGGSLLVNLVADDYDPATGRWDNRATPGAFNVTTNGDFQAVPGATTGVPQLVTPNAEPAHVVFNRNRIASDSRQPWFNASGMWGSHDWTFEVRCCGAAAAGGGAALSNDAYAPPPSPYPSHELHPSLPRAAGVAPLPGHGHGHP